MADNQVEDVSRQPDVDAVQSHDMEKAYGETVETTPDKEEHVVDVDANGYVNHNIVIDEATNKRLRKMINWRCVPVLWAKSQTHSEPWCIRALVHHVLIQNFSLIEFFRVCGLATLLRLLTRAL
jgi:hypothetical protein